MKVIKAHFCNIGLYPDDNQAYKSLHPLLSKINRFEYIYKVLDPNVNQGQLTTDFDERFEQAILSQGATKHLLNLGVDIPQQLDFAFCYSGKIVAVEVEKANREKILRDILKAHMYLRSGADYALIALSKNYPHSHGIWNLYDFGVKRFQECRTYGFGTQENLNRILLMGYEQCDAETNEPLDTSWRAKIRKLSRGGL